MEVKRRSSTTLVSRLSSDSDQARSEPLCELRLLSKHDPDTRLLIADAGGVALLLKSLYLSTYENDPTTQENAMATLFNISISHRETLMSTPVFLDSLAHVLRRPASPSAAQTAAATLHSLLVVDTYRQIIGTKPQLFSPLLSLIQPPNHFPARSIKDALKALFGVALCSHNRPSLVNLGAVPLLFNLVLIIKIIYSLEILFSSFFQYIYMYPQVGQVVKDGRAGVVEDATAVIAQLAGCSESVEAFRKVSAVEVLVDLLDTATGSTVRVRENAVAALLNLVQFRDVEAEGIGTEGIEEVAERGSAKGKVKAAQLLLILKERRYHINSATNHQLLFNSNPY